MWAGRSAFELSGNGKMAPAPGYAPGFSDRKSDVLRLHHAGKEIVRRSTEESNLGRLKQARLFSGQLPRPIRTCSLDMNWKWLSGVDSHHDTPLNRRACSFDITGE